VFEENGWQEKADQCQDINGNIFTSLFSRKGGAAFVANPLPNANRKFPFGATYPEPMNKNEGIWDAAFEPNEICRAYGPEKNFGSPTGNGGNWHAIRIKFDPITRQFQGYDAFYCDQSLNQGNIKYEVTFYLRQWCSAVADITSDPTSLDENTSPWTNRLWRPGYILGEPDLIFGGFTGLAYEQKMENAPFASLSLNKITKTTIPIALTPIFSRADCKGDAKLTEEFGLSSCSFSLGVTDSEQLYKQYYSGGPYSCPNGTCVRTEGKNNQVKTDGASGLSENEGKGYLARIFARVNKVLRFDATVDNKGVQKGYLSKNEKLDVTETANKIPKVPWIFPAVNCDGEKCLEDNTAPGVTVNNVTDKDVRMPVQSGRVFMRFFAFADADQMPLRNVKVVWGDEKAGEPIEGLPGLFRNHRGYKQPECKLDKDGKNGKCVVNQIDDSKPCSKDNECGLGGRCILTAPGSTIGKCLVPREVGNCETRDDCQLTSTCVDKEKAQTFGQIIDQTCDNNYIQFTHVYNCAKGGEGWEPDTTKCDGKDANSSAFPRGCCIFTPRVQVTDNWGWCNGRCGDNTTPGGEGCYNKVGSIFECRDFYKNASVPFKGRVILAPPLR
jgi:hypothetical protein